MYKFSNNKTEITRASLNLMPPMIRSTLIEKMNYDEKCGFTRYLEFTFGNTYVSIQRSKLFNAVREFFSDGLVKNVTDKKGHSWSIKNISKKDDIPNLEIYNGEQCIILPNLVELSPDKTMRVRYFDKTASNVNLPNNVREVWRKILLERSLNDNEIDTLREEFNNTPIRQAQIIRSEILGAHCEIKSLVPNSRAYFERLIGTFDGSQSIYDYALGNGKVFLEQLSMWQPYNGFLFSLLLSSHSALTSQININQISTEDFMKALYFIEKKGDILSQLGAIEIGLRVISSKPEIEPNIIRFIEHISNDDINKENSQLKLFSTLFILVDGQLSRTRLFSCEPPFYRRLAALSQAALINREFIDSGVDIDSFCEWAFNNCAEQYYLQSLVDIRIEPRWNPDNWETSQVKAEFLGRIINSSLMCEQNINVKKIIDVIYNEISKIRCNPIQFVLPGPLEGTKLTKFNLPDEISKAIEGQIGMEKLGISSFVALINSAQIFSIGVKEAELAAKALNKNNYQIDDVKDSSQLFIILNGLATVASVTRSYMLANELRKLVNRYKYYFKYDISIDKIIKICIVSASSHEKLDDWIEFVGSWLTELAFDNLNDDDGNVLYSCIRHLCHIVPELWVTCGRAEAALRAHNERNC